jgi:hypothetical protein
MISATAIATKFKLCKYVFKFRSLQSITTIICIGHGLAWLPRGGHWQHNEMREHHPLHLSHCRTPACRPLLTTHHCAVSDQLGEHTTLHMPALASEVEPEVLQASTTSLSRPLSTMKMSGIVKIARIVKITLLFILTCWFNQFLSAGVQASEHPTVSVVICRTYQMLTSHFGIDCYRY